MSDFRVLHFTPDEFLKFVDDCGNSDIVDVLEKMEKKESQKKMKHPFVFQKPSLEMVTQIEKVREKCSELYDLLNELPESRYRSVAITNLEQVSMWANKGIVMAEPTE